MSSQTSKITRHNCTMASGGGSRDLVWPSMRSHADGVQECEYAGQGSVWSALDLWKSCVRQIEKGMALYRNAMEPCSTSVPIQEWVLVVRHAVLIAWDDCHGLCGYSGVMTSWFSSTSLADGFYWSQISLGLICLSFDGVRVSGGGSLRRWFQVVPISCRRCLNTDFLCVALASYSLMERSVSAMSSLRVIIDVQMRGLIKPHYWNCPILSQFREIYVIHVWLFRYGQEQRQWE